MAFFCAVPMALFALIEPLGIKKSAVKQVWCTLWLLLSSPVALFAIGSILDHDGTFVHTLRNLDFVEIGVIV